MQVKPSSAKAAATNEWWLHPNTSHMEDRPVLVALACTSTATANRQQARQTEATQTLRLTHPMFCNMSAWKFPAHWLQVTPRTPPLQLQHMAGRGFAITIVAV